MRSVVNSVFLSPPKSNPLPLFWSGLGEEHRESVRYRWDGLKRGKADQVLFQLTLAGEGKLRIAGSDPLTLGPGTGFVIRLPSDHVYYYEKGSPRWHFVWAMWSGPALGAIWESLNKTFVRLVTLAPDSPEIRLLRATNRSHSGVGSNSPLDAVEAFRFLVEICAGVASTVPGGKRTDISSRINRLYHRQPGASIGKDGIARHLRLSRFQLYRAAKKELGVSPKEWLARQKIQRACRSLKDRSLSIAAVARKVGLADANYFARFFRSRTGHTPRDWRRLFCR